MCTEVAYLQIFSGRVLQTLNQISQILYCKFPTNKVEKEFVEIVYFESIVLLAQLAKKKIKIDVKQIFQVACEGKYDRPYPGIYIYIQVHICTFLSRHTS